MARKGGMKDLRLEAGVLSITVVISWRYAAKE